MDGGLSGFYDMIDDLDDFSEEEVIWNGMNGFFGGDLL